MGPKHSTKEIITDALTNIITETNTQLIKIILIYIIYKSLNSLNNITR